MIILFFISNSFFFISMYNQKNLLHIYNDIKRYSNTLFHLLKIEKYWY